MLQQLCQVHAVAFSTRQIANTLLLVAAFEVEACNVCTAVNFTSTNLQRFCTIGNFLVHGCIGIQCVAVLIHVTHLHSVTNGDGARAWCFLASEHAEQRGFTRAVWSDNANDASRWKREGQVFNQHSVAEALHQVLHFNHGVTQTRAGRNHDF